MRIAGSAITWPPDGWPRWARIQRRSPSTSPPRASSRRSPQAGEHSADLIRLAGRLQALEDRERLLQLFAPAPEVALPDGDPPGDRPGQGFVVLGAELDRQGERALDVRRDRLTDVDDEVELRQQPAGVADEVTHPQPR